MTVTTTTNTVTASGNGAQTVFNYGFKIPNQSSAVLTVTTGGLTTTIDNSAWSITNLGSPSGGTFTYPLTGSPVAIGSTLTLTRDVSPIQPTQLLNQGAVYPSVIESAMDWIVLALQDATEALQVALTALAARVAALEAGGGGGGGRTADSTLIFSDTTFITADAI